MRRMTLNAGLRLDKAELAGPIGRPAPNADVGGLDVDIYDLFNDNTVLTPNNTFEAQWRQPLSILQGRTFKFGIQANEALK